MILFITGWTLPAQFADSYYGALSVMYENLRSSKDKKIVIIGNSGVAFGIYSDYLETELQKEGLHYEVCNFGLYGSLGTKLMLDLSREHINEGDIVVFMPEVNEQSLSLYFSASETWRALDSNMEMFEGVALENRDELIGNYVSYTAEKFAFYQGKNTLENMGIYARSSFDESGDLTLGVRDYNVMNGGYDPNDIVNFDKELLNDAFFGYVNDYYADVKAKGATMYFTFCPLNEKALAEDCTREKIDDFYNEIRERIEFPLLGNPHDYIMEYEWFYDTNVHLNTMGMIVRTVGMLNDLKMELGCYTATDIELPEKPVIPEVGLVEGNNEYAKYFEYAEDGAGVKIVALKEEGKSLEKLTIPVSYEGKAITTFDASVFAGNTTIKEIVVQENILRLNNGCFDGCTSLKAVYLEQTDPSKINPGFGFLMGTQNCFVYVKQESYGSFVTTYLWGYHQEYIKTY
ncbi:MAG: hypothetical protein IJW96_01885 [Clostridia bacterium]|nr:hypothetical protein [Clostridia bacterium]